MGFPSYLEDIRDRANELQGLLEPADDLIRDLRHDKRYVQAVVRLQELVRVAKQLLNHVDKAVDLATDPGVDLASRVRQLEEVSSNRDSWRVECKCIERRTLAKFEEHKKHVELERTNAKIETKSLRRELKIRTKELKEVKKLLKPRGR
jgi:hypothetical protein